MRQRLVIRLEMDLGLAPEIQVEATLPRAEEHPQERNMALLTGQINPAVAAATALVVGGFTLQREVM